MKYRRRTPLRGSVTQNMTRVRMKPREMTPGGFMLRLGALVGSVIIVLGLAAWLWHIGWPQRQAEHLTQAGLQMTQKARFAVRDVIIEGRQQASKEALSAALGISTGAAILSFEPEAAQAKIAKLPWVASATVERRLPDTIYVRLTEKQPLARWQRQGRIIVIDSEGQELREAKTDQFSQLPLVVGADAAAETANLLETLKEFPAVEDKMTAAVRVSGRRWDVHLESRVVARLPEADMADGLKRLSELITVKKILERNITAIDLRLPDRLIIESGQAPHPGDTRL
ncbi:MAG: FtsQ-type POTRA domain-containing protein [Alphaproteobacteria bacterium]|nr:FtsQ-type POTRA domain-containing protein [Alphaproteobacteria bacterium]